MQPALRAFDHPAPFTQAIARLDAVTDYVWSNATAAQPGPMGTRSIGLVGILGGLAVKLQEAIRSRYEP